MIAIRYASDDAARWLSDFVAIATPDFVMMVNAYFDESGTHVNSSVACVAGYLYEAEQALILDCEWREALAQFGLTHFHAVDCTHARKEFVGLAPRDRDELVSRLIGIIRRRMAVGIAVSLSDSDFGAVDLGDWRFDGAYPLCAMWVLAGVVAWAEKHQYSGKISYFFEKGHRHQTQTQSAIDMLHARPSGERYLRFHSVTFAGKKDIRPLQTADVLAYEWYRELKRLNEPPAGKPRVMRKALEGLLQSPHMQYHFSARDVAQFLEKGGAALSQRFDFVW
jgi:Protein of unknown function (DUF3800)